MSDTLLWGIAILAAVIAAGALLAAFWQWYAPRRPLRPYAVSVSFTEAIPASESAQSEPRPVVFDVMARSRWEAKTKARAEFERDAEESGAHWPRRIRRYRVRRECVTTEGTENTEG